MKTELEGWWFSTANKKLGYSDNRPVVVGVTHTVDGPPVLCEHGLHLSVLPLDALSYATGSVIWRVKISGNIIISDDKAVGNRRTYLAGGIDISDELRAFARAEALRVTHLWDAPTIVYNYLRTGDESLRKAAEEAAWAAWAARAAAGAAARAAWTAAWEAAGEAAGAVAGAVAWEAAGEAAGAVAEGAAGEAARAAAWTAARAAEKVEISRQNETLEEIFNRAIKFP